ncbi:hypothetical protein [Hymenobacter jejuensis]|uniref:Uncharacterized protein n=1 Tax=Hymenobacter jejuensis TaxID=2502781 RepID=A0A5B8A753_9BACT|nr:hypothetical protein [Hymenobacter jejuensis]QDA62262.1 hypothetical protein FHG12_20120 [Hymenobacter jejuensis]
MSSAPVFSHWFSLAAADSRYGVRLHVGPTVPAPLRPFAFEPFLFLRPEHLNLQPFEGEIFAFYLEDSKTQQTVAQWHTFVATGAEVAYSPWQAPFGSLQLAAGLEIAALRAFVEAARTELAQRGIRQIRLKSYPFAYDPAASALLTDVLVHQGFRVTLAELNNQLPLARDFRAHLVTAQELRLKRCHRAGFVFEQESPLLLTPAHAFISACRREKGHSEPLSLERLQELFAKFPRDHFLFSIRDAAGEWAALAIVVQISSKVLYSFYLASPLSYNLFSPVVMLLEGIHGFGRANGHRLLDIGTSTLPTGLNASLLAFKRHIGGVPGLKLTFEI